MNGLEVDLNPSVIGTNGKAIIGLYATGELAAGTNDNNRLGSQSMLEGVYLVASLANMRRRPCPVLT
jgi:predicted oxidoreductase